MSKLTKALTAAAGNAGESLYVEDVFSTYLYEGTGSSLAINNGLDLSGEGGLMWFKGRDGPYQNKWYDTERGIQYAIESDTTDANQTEAQGVTAVGSSGFTLGTDGNTNSSGATYASWTFREAEKFCSIVTFTGTGSAQTINHSLGSKPGFYVVKQTSGTGGSWYGYHAGLDSTYTNPSGIRLDSTSAAFEANSTLWNLTFPTSTTFTVGTSTGVNASGETYVAYLFASDAGGFGDDESENIIKCGSYTGAGANLEINVGFEPQFVLIKCTTTAGTNWVMFDTMRGLPVDGNARDLRPNASDAEADNSAIGITSTGFLARNGIDGQINASGRSYIYIAIRRPMKTPESGTEVFAPISLGTTTEPGFVSNFVTDFTIHRTVNEVGSRQVSSRMTGNGYMFSNATNAEGSISAIQWDFMNGSRVGNGTANANEIQWMFKRATGFMDAAAYIGVDTNNTQIVHNLGVVPEMIWAKSRSDAQQWSVLTYDGTTGRQLRLDANTSGTTPPSGSIWGNGTNFVPPTSSVFTIGDYSNINTFGATYIAYLFATLAGVSKVGKYIGTGADLNVDCGFSAGARFILIKRSDSTGDWYVWDSLRGISAGNDPYLLLNTTDVEATGTDYIDPLSSGFTVTSSAPAALNASGGTYIFLAIA